MKKQLIMLYLFLITVSANAIEINFIDNPVWSSVLEKAKKENKAIFLYGYGKGCDICKGLEDNFKYPEIAAYFNANFINVRYNMDKDVGQNLRQKYDVKSYPLLAFTDQSGAMIMHEGAVSASDLVDFGKEGKKLVLQYVAGKKNALNFPTADFYEFVKFAVDAADDEIDGIINQYLIKQPDILGDANLIKLIMNFASSLPNEKMLAYFKDNKQKIIKAGYKEVDFKECLTDFSVAYGLSAAVQKNPNQRDFAALEKVLIKYVPEEAFYLTCYAQARYELEKKNYNEALKALLLLIDNTPTKISYAQTSAIVMRIGIELGKYGKEEEILKKFDAIVIPAKEANLAYSKSYIRLAFALQKGDDKKFKSLANAMLSDPGVPENIKKELRLQLSQIKP